RVVPGHSWSCVVLCRAVARDQSSSFHLMPSAVTIAKPCSPQRRHSTPRSRHRCDGPSPWLPPVAGCGSDHHESGISRVSFGGELRRGVDQYDYECDKEHHKREKFEWDQFLQPAYQPAG